MADFLDFVPLTRQTIDTVRARLDADANAGVDPSSDEFIDTTEGGFFFDLTQAVALELARLWDFASVEVPAVCFPTFAYGEYLDEHGELLGLERKDAAKAGGVVRFTGTNTTLVALGTVVATEQIDPDEDPPSFITTESGTISGGFVDLDVEAVDAGTLGNVSASTVTVLVTPNSGVSAVNNAAAITGGADIESDEDYRERILLELSGGGGAGTQADYIRWALAYPGIGGAVCEPAWNGAGTVRVIVTDTDNNPVPTATVYGLQDYLDPPQFLTTITTGGTLPTGTINVASTTGFAASGTFRLGTEVVTYTGVTATTFTGCTGGTGAFSIGDRVAQGFAQGRGVAPIGAEVTVATVTTSTITVVATPIYDAGYTASGAGGTVALGDAIKAEIEKYLDSLRPGDDVVYNAVLSRVMRVAGVEDVSALTVNGGTSNVSIAALVVAVAGTITVN